MQWEEKLNKFLEEFEYKTDIIGVLVCGSYITGSLNSHSDLDVHILLRYNAGYRQRGNKIVDGLLIEYFANTEDHIKEYFEEDIKRFRLMSQTQFVTRKNNKR